MELITLNQRELLRLQTTQQVVAGGRTVAEAAAILGLSTRQVKRLSRRLRLHGAAAFAFPQRGKTPNNAFDAALHERVLALARSDYEGFGPTFLAEKLAEREEVTISRETLRRWLIEAKMHRPRRRREHPRPMRERRARLGELVQADGSPHRWFEDRGDPCSLLLYIDDATSSALGGLFVEHESTDGYFELFERAFTQHGLPMALYVDKHGVFRINHPGATVDHETHVQRALRELGVELICANSPQAKGRVERANRTLQDRLVKEFRLVGISSIAEANRALPAYLKDFNRRFAIQPRQCEDAHRSSEGLPLTSILAKRYERVLTSNLTFQIHDRIFAIDPSPLHRLRKGMRITVGMTRTGEPFIIHKHSRIEPRFVGLRQRTARIVETKRLNEHIDRRVPNPKKAHPPAKNHPWQTSMQLAAAKARGHL